MNPQPEGRKRYSMKPVFPAQTAVIAVELHYSASEMALIREGFDPETMEDKWLLHYADDVLYFVRSWTGFVIYELRFRPDGDNQVGFEIIANRDSGQYRHEMHEDPVAHDVAQVQLLIDDLLLRDLRTSGQNP
jgi:hypothetical protein